MSFSWLWKKLRGDGKGSDKGQQDVFQSTPTIPGKIEGRGEGMNEGISV